MVKNFFLFFSSFLFLFIFPFPFSYLTVIFGSFEIKQNHRRFS